MLFSTHGTNTRTFHLADISQLCPTALHIESFLRQDSFHAHKWLELQNSTERDDSKERPLIFQPIKEKNMSCEHSSSSSWAGINTGVRQESSSGVKRNKALETCLRAEEMFAILRTKTACFMGWEGGDGSLAQRGSFLRRRPTQGKLRRSQMGHREFSIGSCCRSLGRTAKHAPKKHAETKIITKHSVTRRWGSSKTHDFTQGHSFTTRNQPMEME